ncbi:hypothetical protein [Dyadobacter frigoris]|uniref:Uncharacterized protein n=1 Tax=Dyadobacter frigoris TaxID=2576211 RepID=A0A4U6D7Y1_9BACT|nr:hypothetical protein [Dyadobacter frigoris]TKT92655.1 hypothetical protein FDK13_07520 [Dyadobacter frigoris]
MNDDKRARMSAMISYIQAEYLMKYGMEMDEWSAINFAEIREHFGVIRKELNANLLESKKLQQTFKGSISSVHFASDKQSFLHGLGVSIPYAVCVLILGFLCYYYLSTFKMYQGISRYVEDLKNIESYQDLVREGNIRTQNGVEFLILKQAKPGDNTFGRVYEFDGKRKEVHVPLRRLK